MPAAPTELTMPAEDPTTVIATVAGTDYTLSDFDRSFRMAVARSANAQGMPYNPDMNASFAQFRPQFLTTFVRQQATLQLAKKSGAQADDASIDAQLKTGRDQFPKEEEYVTALQGSGFMDEADYRASLAEQQVVSNYLKAIQGRFKFSDSLIAGFYSLNKASFTKKAEACVKHILVPTEAEATKLVSDLAAGGDFAALAKAQSKDPGSAANGGDLGCLGAGETVPEFDKAAFSGPLGKVQMVKSQFGYHVLVVTKRSEAGLTPLSEVSGQIRDQLAAEAAQKYLDAQVSRLKTQTYADRLPAAPAAPADKEAPADAAPADAAPADAAPSDAPAAP